MDGVSRTNYVGGSGDAGGVQPNRNGQQNQPAITLQLTSQRVVPAELLRVNTQHASNNGASRPAVGIGSGVAFFTRNVADHVRTTGQWQQIQGGNATTNSVPAEVVINLLDSSATLQLGNGHPHHYPLNTTEFQNRYGQSMQDFVAQYIPSQMGTLIPDIVHDDLGPYLSPNDIHNLGQVNRHLRNTTAPRRQAITNAMLLARGEATVLRSGNVVRQDPPVMNPAQFDSALRYIQNLPPNHQREPLQELVRHATTQAQFGAVLDHLRNQGRLPHIPLPANFAALSPATQRCVEIFSWRLSGHTFGNPPVPSTPQRRNQLLNNYTQLMQAIDGFAYPEGWIDVVPDHEILDTLPAFNASDGLNATDGRAWLHEQANQDRLRLTPEIWERLPRGVQTGIYQNLPGSFAGMLQSSVFAYHMPLYPQL